MLVVLQQQGQPDACSAWCDALALPAAWNKEDKGYVGWGMIEALGTSVRRLAAATLLIPFVVCEYKFSQFTHGFSSHMNSCLCSLVALRRTSCTDVAS